MLNTSASLMIQRASARRAASGMTLVEVLVSLVVISVGLLGVAALQITSLRNSQASFLRTQATAMADDIIDRMRANRTVALSGQYNLALEETITLTGSSTQADKDKADWKTALKKNLPKVGNADADGSITIVKNLVTVTIQWGERDPNNATMKFITQTEI
jgi:type IV pilus assembly protein PilV